MKKIFTIFAIVSVLIAGLTVSNSFAQNYSGGSGTSEIPWQISNTANLSYLSTHSDDWDNHFIQTANITAPVGFSPIGNSTTNFTGSYNGGYHTINGLSMAFGGLYYIGFFGVVHGASISNLGLTNVNITGYIQVGGLAGRSVGNTTITNCNVTGTSSVSGAQYVGGLIGFNGSGSSSTSTISYCNSSATVSGTGIGSRDNIGGLVGINQYSSISNSYSTGSVTGGDNVGGLVGNIDWNSTLENCYHTTGDVTGVQYTGGLIGRGGYNAPVSVNLCYNTAAVYGGGSGYTGGLVGQTNNGGVIISNCYNTGNVSGSYEVGGLMGRNNGSVSKCYSTGSVIGTGNTVGGLIGNGSNISNSYSTGSVSGVSGAHTVGGLIGTGGATNCYSTGYVSGGSPVGGLIGTSGTATACFWDITTSGQPTSAGGDGAMGKTTAEMKTQSTYTGWNFTTIWQMIGYNYPDIIDNSNPVLPVELTSFIASVNINDVTLNWSTAWEINNAGFDIERQSLAGGRDIWTKIGFVEGNGTTNEPKNYSYQDRKLQSGNYNYRLVQRDYNNRSIEHFLSDAVTVGVPTKYGLSQNYPNPFNPTTKIDYDIPYNGRVSIVMYDITGREIANIVNEVQTAGYYTVEFNASNFASGVYFYRIIVKDGQNDFIMTKKMVLVK